MAGIGSLLFALSGQPDPERQLAQLLSGQQQPGQQPPQGPPPAAAPSSAGGAGADPNAPAAAPNAPVAPGAQMPNAGPQPQALQSSPDMAASYNQLANPPNNIMSLYVQMDQRNRAIQGINMALATIAANHSPPSMRAAIMQGIGGAGGDAGATMGNLMSLYQAQQGMAAQGQLLGQAPAIAAKLGMDEGVVRAEIMAGRGSELIKSLEPTPEIRDITAKHDMFIKNGGTEDDWKNNYLPFIISGGAGGGDSATQSWRTERIRWQQENPGQPVPWGTDDPQSFALWKAGQNKLKDDQTDALQKRQPYVQNLTDLRNSVGGVVGLKPGDSFQTKDDGSIDTSNLDPAKYQALQHALSAPGAQLYLSSDPTAWTTQNVSGAALTDDDKRVLDDIRSATNPKAIFGSVSGKMPRRSQSDVAQIGSSLEDIRNIRRSPADWLGSVAKGIAATDTATGNAFGASGEAEAAPDYTKKYIDSSYLQGGSMYPFGKKAAPMSQDQITAATNALKGASNPEAERQKLIHLYLADNVDPTPLRNLRF